MYPIIIGIAGGSGSGKTTFAQNLKKNLKMKLQFYLTTFTIKIMMNLLLKKEKN